jgi:hypothetical protein
MRGVVYGSIHRCHRATEFKKFLTKLDNNDIPAELDVHLSPTIAQLAGPPPPVSHALHPDLFLVAQPSRRTRKSHDNSETRRRESADVDGVVSDPLRVDRRRLVISTLADEKLQ